MSFIHVHLLLNHIPIMGVAFGLLVLLAALYFHSADLRRASLVIFILIGAAAGAAYFTGEEAEEAVKGLSGFTEATVLRHDDAAWYAVIAAILLGLVALGGLWRFRGTAAPPRWFTATALTLAILTSGLMVWTGWIGGQIRHSELSGAPAPSAATAPPGAPSSR
jgi:uncharacterized membrane protein